MICDLCIFVCRWEIGDWRWNVQERSAYIREAFQLKLFGYLPIWDTFTPQSEISAIGLPGIMRSVFALCLLFTRFVWSFDPPIWAKLRVPVIEHPIYTSSHSQPQNSSLSLPLQTNRRQISMNTLFSPLSLSSLSSLLWAFSHLYQTNK